MTRTRGAPQTGKRQIVGWNEREEEALTQAWIFISQDSVKGNARNAEAFFGEVVTHFWALLEVDEPYRTYDSVNSKWRELKKMLTEFAGCFNRAWNEKASGTNQINLMTVAHSLYKTKVGKEFTHLKAWEAARGRVRWCPHPGSQYTMSSSTTDSNKRPRSSDSEVRFDLNLSENDEEINMVDDSDFEVDKTRPIGRDVAKRAAKGKSVASSEESLVGKWDAHLSIAKERTELAKERAQGKAKIREQQQELILQQNQMLEQQKQFFEQQKDLMAKQDRLVQQQSDTLFDQQMLVGVEILSKVPQEGVPDASQDVIADIQRRIRERYARHD